MNMLVWTYFKLYSGKKGFSWSDVLFQEDFPVDLENCITLDELEEDDSDDQGIPGSLVMLNTKHIVVPARLVDF